MNSVSPELGTAGFEGDQIEVVWNDGQCCSFHPLWLRDNCRCPGCGDPAIGYRQLRLTDIDQPCRANTIGVDDNHLVVIWQDGHESRYPAHWLQQHAYQDRDRQARSFKPVLWDDAFRDKPPSFDFAEIDNDAALLEVLHRVRDYGLCFLRKAPAEPGIVEALTTRFGYPQESNFGRIQDLRFDPSRRSIANNVQALKPHTDEPYRASPPGLLIFHCITNDQTGAGSSLFTDGFEIAEGLRLHDPEAFDALCRNPQAFRRHFDGDVDLIAEFPILSVDEFGHLNGIRLNDRVAAPLSIAPDQLDVFYRGLRYLLELSEDEHRAVKLTLQPGDIAIFDNHRVLHGRTDLTIDGQRWLQWVQIERGDFHSSLRILADRLGLERDANPLLRGAYGSTIQRRHA